MKLEDYLHYGVTEAKFSPKMRELGNALWLELKHNHRGKNNVICADKLVEIINSAKPELKASRLKLWRCVSKLREKGYTVVSTAKDYYLDDSFEALLTTARLFARQSAATLQSFKNVAKLIEKRYGKDAIPQDIHEFLDWLYEDEKEEEEEFDD